MPTGLMLALDPDCEVRTDLLPNLVAMGAVAADAPSGMSSWFTATLHSGANAYNAAATNGSSQPEPQPPRFDVLTSNSVSHYRDKWALRSATLGISYDCWKV